MASQAIPFPLLVSFRCLHDPLHVDEPIVMYLFDTQRRQKHSSSERSHKAQKQAISDDVSHTSVGSFAVLLQSTKPQCDGC